MSTNISQAELLSRINNRENLLIFDVRSPKEFNSGHIPGAINIPFGDHEREISLLMLERNIEIIVYCESGYRADKVERYLKEKGYFEVRHLAGDMQAWRKTNDREIIYQ